MKLSDYLSGQNESPAAFAAAIGVSRQAVHRYKAGERVPRPEVLSRIRAATNGAVTADDFMPAPREAAQ